MRPEDCSKLNTCERVLSILGRDMLDEQVAEGIRAVCSKCENPSVRVGYITPRCAQGVAGQGLNWGWN